MIPLNQENMRQVLILAAAIVVGIIAVGMVGQYVTSQVQNETQRLAVEYQQAQKAKEQEYEKQMAALHQEMKKIEASAKKAAEDAARTAAQQARPVVVENKGPVKKPSLALKTPKGKRAVTVLIDSLGAVGGLLNPGDAVDVIAHLDVPVPRKAKKDTGKETITAMLFQNLLILAVNTNVEDVGTLYDQQQADKALKVTFAVSPEEAGLLAFADKNGSLELALRAPTEKNREMVSAATWAALADYALENNGTDIEQLNVVEEKEEAVTIPDIQVFRGGREL